MVAIDPTPHERLIELSKEYSELELIQEPSHEALGRIELPDAVIIDGDHNYYTVSEELRLIDERAAGAELPLLVLHDVGWPHGRRDAYWSPESIPDETSTDCSAPLHLSGRARCRRRWHAYVRGGEA